MAQSITANDTGHTDRALRTYPRSRRHEPRTRQPTNIHIWGRIKYTAAVNNASTLHENASLRSPILHVSPWGFMRRQSSNVLR